MLISNLSKLELRQRNKIVREEIHKGEKQNILATRALTKGLSSLRLDSTIEITNDVIKFLFYLMQKAFDTLLSKVPPLHLFPSNVHLHLQVFIVHLCISISSISRLIVTAFLSSSSTNLSPRDCGTAIFP